MKVVLICCVFLLVALGSTSAQALEPLVLYDDFNAKRINPDKWSGARGGNADPLEAIRQIHGNHLRLTSSFYGNTDFDTGNKGGAFQLAFVNPAAVTAIEATVRVQEAEVTSCTIPGSEVSVAEARLEGRFFNTGTNDVVAIIRISRQSGSPTPQNVFQVQAGVFLCNNGSCPPLNSHNMGSINRGEEVRLRIQWDPDNHQFIFRRDDAPAVFSPYTVSDAAPPASQYKVLGINAQAANCTAAPRPTAFMQVFFDDVFVNASAAPPPSGGEVSLGADLVWRNTSTGAVALWLLDGFNILAAQVLGTAPLEWQIVGVGDVNGDGQADLVWRNTTTGAAALWLLNGFTILDARVLATVPLEWQIVGVGDVNGDGQAISH